MHLDTANYYATINSTAFVVQVVPYNVDKPILTIVRHEEGLAIPTNVASLIDMIHQHPRSDTIAVHLMSGADEMRSSIQDNCEDQEL